MTAILQISDTHIVPDGCLVSGKLDTAKSLQKLCAHIFEIQEHIGPIDALLVSGDLTDDGTSESYTRFQELMAPLNLPVLVVPGNHDKREPMRAAFADQLPQSGYLNWERRIGEINVIGLDTLVEGQGYGLLAAESLTFLEQALNKENNAPVLLTLHHPPFISGIDFMDNIGLTNQGALYKLLEGYPGQLRIVCGHIHTLMISDVAGHTAISAPSPCSSFAYDLRKNAPIGFYTQEDGCLLHRWTKGFQTIRVAPTLGNGPYPF